MNTRATEADDLKIIGYVSSAAEPVDSDALADLEGAARVHNRAAGITGLLVFDDGCYVQVLEGPAEAVDATLARIRRDPRHEDIDQVLDAPIDTRSFGRWALASIDLRAPAASVGIDELAEGLEGFLGRVGTDLKGSGTVLQGAFQQLLGLLDRARDRDGREDREDRG